MIFTIKLILLFDFSILQEVFSPLNIFQIDGNFNKIQPEHATKVTYIYNYDSQFESIEWIFKIENTVDVIVIVFLIKS